MASIESFAHIECIINGFRFTGWADEDPPYEFEYESSSTRTRGPDGGLYALGLTMYGGMWTFKMMPNSPTTQWAIQQEQMRKDAHVNGSPFRYYEGTIIDSVQGVSFRLEGGIIDIFPATKIPGVTYEGTIDFEKITSLVDGGMFSPPLVTVGP